MTISKNREGAWVISALTSGANSYLLTRVYYFITKKDALASFKKELARLSE